MKLKEWADAFQRFMLRLASSFFLTYLAFDIELKLFVLVNDNYNIECVFWQGYLAAIAAVWLCFHLLLYRKDAP